MHKIKASPAAADQTIVIKASPSAADQSYSLRSVSRPGSLGVLPPCSTELLSYSACFVYCSPCSLASLGCVALGFPVAVCLSVLLCFRFLLFLRGVLLPRLSEGWLVLWWTSWAFWASPCVSCCWCAGAFFLRVSRGMKSLCARTAPCLFMPTASRVGPQRILCQLATNKINGKAPPQQKLKRRNWGKQLSASFSSVVNLAGNAPSLYARRFKVGSNGPNLGPRVF
jgi:hypothetical protein